MKLSQLHNRFLADLRAQGRSPATLSAYGSDFRVLLDYLRGDDLRKLTPAAVADYGAWLSEQGHHPNGIARKLSSLSSFGEWLERRREVARNPADGVPRPKRRRGLPRPVPTSQADVVLSVGDSRTRAVLSLMRYGGLRIGEVHHLDVEDVGLGGEGTTIITVREGKGGKDRTVPVFGTEPQMALMEWLRERGEKPGPLFPGEAGGRLAVRSIRRALARACKAAQVPVYTPHQLRHTFGTESVRAGVPLRHVQEAMGHADPGTTVRYSQVTGADLLESMRKVADWRRNGKVN